MKNLYLTAVLAMIAGAGSFVHGETAVGQELQGTWLVQVNFTSQTTVFPPAFAGFDTYIPGGEYIGASNVMPQSFHGEWARLGNRVFVQTFRFFIFDPKGAYVAYVKVRALQQLEDSLDHMHGVFIAELYTPDGKLLNSANGVTQSQRMELESPDGLTLESALNARLSSAAQPR